MTPEERRERLANYWVCYYDEIRRQLPNYTTDPESVPHALRDHQRRIQARECKDGYVIVHFSDPENVDSSDHPVRLELLMTDHQNETVGELMDSEVPEDSLPSDAPFWVTHAPFLRNQTTGEYQLMAGWERRDLIANRRIEQWDEEGWREQSGEEAIAQAGEDLKNFFDRQS